MTAREPSLRQKPRRRNPRRGTQTNAVAAFAAVGRAHAQPALTHPRDAISARRPELRPDFPGLSWKAVPVGGLLLSSSVNEAGKNLTSSEVGPQKPPGPPTPTGPHLWTFIAEYGRRPFCSAATPLVAHQRRSSFRPCFSPVSWSFLQDKLVDHDRRTFYLSPFLPHTTLGESPGLERKG